MLGGSGTNRTVAITPTAKTSGTAVVTVTVSDGDLTGQTITVEVGTEENDSITGTAGADLVLGVNGSDVIGAAGGNDLVCGGNGNDTLTGGADHDTLDGGNGNDSCCGGEAGATSSRAATAPTGFSGGYQFSAAPHRLRPSRRRRHDGRDDSLGANGAGRPPWRPAARPVHRC